LYSYTLTDHHLVNYLIFDLVGLTFFLRQLQKWSFTVYSLNIFNYISIAHFSYVLYRTQFLTSVIGVLKMKLREQFQNYFGGNKIFITKSIGKNLFFYDINSLYPYVMLKRLPCLFYKISQYENINFFFWFCIR